MLICILCDFMYLLGDHFFGLNFTVYLFSPLSSLAQTYDKSTDLLLIINKLRSQAFCFNGYKSRKFQISIACVES